MKFIYNQKYEQDCSLIVTINAALWYGTIKSFNINSELYSHYYDISYGSLSPHNVEPYLKIKSERVLPTIDIIKLHISKNKCCEMTTYHSLTGWHSVLLIPSQDNKVQVIDCIVGDLDENEKLKYYDWSKPVDVKYLFELADTYPNKTIECGKIRLFNIK